MATNLVNSLSIPQTTNSITTVLQMASQRLAAAGCDTPWLDAQVLLAHLLGKDRLWLYMHPQERLDKNQQDRFDYLLSRRERREPVAYITGCKEFFALEFQVNRHVLIPRPETELLVETAIQMVRDEWLAPNSAGPGQAAPVPPKTKPWSRAAKQDPAPKITLADVGTGSGCIAIALAKNLPQLSLYAIDISQEALAVAQQNAIRHEVSDRITFLTGNLLQPLSQPVDLIVSNPPYVSSLELAGTTLLPEVSRYEPGLALDGGDDGLEIIRQLLPQTRQKLKPGGSLLVEIGAGQGQAVVELARTCFPHAGIRLKKDLAGLDRLLIIRTSCA